MSGTKPEDGDKLDKAVSALRANPSLTEEELANILGFQRPASARFWRLKALDILGMPTQPQPKEKRTMNMFENIFGFFNKKESVGPKDETSEGRPLHTSNMTQEQLRERRINRIESAKFGRPFHEEIMLFFLKIWLVLGPPAFVVLTVSEVTYIFAAMLPPGDSGDRIIFFGALFVDLAMMFTTFGVAVKRRDLAEKREVNGSVPKREELEVWFGTTLWLVFALINIIGQSAFLLHIVEGSAHPGNLTIVYTFIAARVVGFILGDATTAFFLAKVDNSKLKLIARAEREKSKLYKDMAEAEGERRVSDAETEAKLTIIQIEVQQKREEAEFLAEFKRQAFNSALGNRRNPPGGNPRVYTGS